MKGRKKTKLLKAGQITSYKFPVIKGPEGEAFYNWINSYERYGYRSLNSLITEALKLRFMMDNLKPNAGAAASKNQAAKAEGKESNAPVYDVEDIDFDELSGYSSIEKTFGSIKR